MNEQEFGLGALFSPIDIRDYLLTSVKHTNHNLPDKFQLEVLKIKNQGSKKTCVAFSLSEIIEYHNKRDIGKYQRFSTDFIYGCRNDTDYKEEGMYLRDALKVIQKYGDVVYELLPGNSSVTNAINKVNKNFDKLKQQAYINRISAYYKIKTVDELKYSLFTLGPAVCSMKWYNKAYLNSDKIYTYDKNNDYSGHAVVILGWDENNWILQNSWGHVWGDKGLFKVPINNSFGELFHEVYGVTDEIEKIKKPNKIKKLTAPISNKLLNIVKNYVNK